MTVPSDFSPLLFDEYRTIHAASRNPASCAIGFADLTINEIYAVYFLRSRRIDGNSARDAPDLSCFSVDSGAIQCIIKRFVTSV